MYITHNIDSLCKYVIIIFLDTHIETLKSLTIILHVSSPVPAIGLAVTGSSCVEDYILVKCKQIRFL